MELLSPVGNFDNLIAAVQNGADAVYLGASNFNARAGAQNFDQETLKKAILYARKRGVDVHLTLNTLLFDSEFKKAIEVAKYAYECGISAIIVQDIGLAKELISHFPDLPIHSSTQMTISNISGVNLMEKMGFKRVVLARELSLSEIKKIRENTKMELECFGHGALCVSYSGQCLFSSLVGKRSGNRGLCAGPCRLNYNLLKNGNTIESGYLLSTKDICTLAILPELLQAGVDSLKIEGRKKSYEYVSIVTKIYRKYIDLAKKDPQHYKVDDEDLKQILQIYNRGGMGTGYFENRKNIVYPEKPNHLGIFVGTVKAINSKQKQVTMDLKGDIELGDVISVGQTTSYISQVINKNIIGQIKEIQKVKKGDKVYKIVSGSLNKKQWEVYKKEVKKVEISAKLYETEEMIRLQLTDGKNSAETAIEKPKTDLNELDKSRIICQIQKTGNTIFQIRDIEVKVEHLKLPISQLNKLRRDALEKFENELEKHILRKYKKEIKCDIESENRPRNNTAKINLYIQKWDDSIDYSKLEYDEIYIPFKNLINQKKIPNCVAVLPNIMDENYENLIHQNLSVFDQVEAVEVSHISQIQFLKKLGIMKKIYGNATLNLTNSWAVKVVENFGVSRITMSPELTKEAFYQLSTNLEKEMIVYGRGLLMTSKHCVIGKNADCHKRCRDRKL